MFDSLKIEAVTERDIDLLVLEELTVSESFRTWFAAQALKGKTYSSNIGAWHSVTAAGLGESDLIFMLRTRDGTQAAILIEDKVDAQPQPDQAHRYELRGIKGVGDGSWDMFTTCIIAPAAYLDSSKHDQGYDVAISYEQMVEYFESQQDHDQRSGYKAEFINDAIEQNRRGYQPVIDEKLSRFVNSYCNYTSVNYHELAVEAPRNRPAENTWIKFYPKFLPSGCDMVHQMTAGCVKLFFRGQAESFDALKEKYSSVLPEGAEMKLTPSKKSVSIILPVPKIDPQKVSFEAEAESIKRILRQVKDLAERVQRGS